MAGADIERLYRLPVLVWRGPPLALYRQAVMWLLTAHGAIGEDPVLFATRDASRNLALGVMALRLAPGA